ncbi:MAG: hypothetical protein KF799_02330 [Bdellovibrionales bacterium]|nr:hypothetical protein [Bdellovibrionales bacterium]
MIPAPVRSLSRLAVAQMLVGALGTLLIGLFAGLHQGASFGAGAALMLGNMVALAWGWWRVITQKTIAWTVLIIVIKYAVLLSTIYFLARAPWFNVALAGFGVTSFVLAALLWAITSKEFEVKKEI